jgi:hypothetical protein
MSSTWNFPRWRMLYCDYAGNRYGEILDAHERQFNFSLLQPNTISFQPKLSASMTANLLTNREGLILLTRNSTLAMTAELTSIQVTGDDTDHGYTVVATETMYPRLNKRLLGQSSAGLTGPTTATDQGQWLMDRLEDLNAINRTGLRAGVTVNSGIIAGGTWRYKAFMELMLELSATVNGFDYYQRPRDPLGQIGPVSPPGITGVIDIKPVIGQTRKDVIFAYGGVPDNARSYQWNINATNVINKGIVLPPSFPDNAGLKVVTASDATSQSVRGLREEVIPSDLSDATLRTQLAQLHVNLRKVPQEQFIIQPAQADGTKRVPQFLDDYNIGDMIRGRVTDQGLLMLDAMVRAYGAQISLSDEGQETVDLTLINDGAATS